VCKQQKINFKFYVNSNDEADGNREKVKSFLMRILEFL
jgi:hypothetical protein